MKVLTTTPFLSGAPGEAVTCRVRVENDSDLASAYEIRVLGFDADHVLIPDGAPVLPAGGVAEVDLRLLIPDAIPPGNHAVGVEVRSARRPDAGSLASVTVSVGSLDRLLLTVNPSSVRGHRSGRFWVDVLNRDREPVELQLAGDATDGEVRITPAIVRVEPNQRVRARGRVTGPLRFFGDPRQLPFTVSARGRSAPVYAPATYQQRPLFPRPLRAFLAILLAIALWASALGAGVWWWANRGDDTEPSAEAVELVDVDGDGVAETPADQLVDTDSDGVPDTPAAQAAAAAAAAAAEDGGEAGEGEALPTFTLINGTVKAGETGQNDGVLVTLTPITLGGEPSPAAVGFRGAEAVQATKLWPARYGVSATSGLTSVRQTETLTDLSEGADGAFVIPDVLIRQTYEISFAKPGFDTQSFVVTPTKDGKPVEMEIVLEPAAGALGGRVTGGGGGLGNVAIGATDGTLQFATTSASEGDVGGFSLPAVSTPSTYTITATLRGYGTEVIQVPLEPGEQRTDLSIAMRPGVGSIIGRVNAGGAPLGGATLTVSSSDDTRTTTSLTDGDVGLYNFPQLEIPGTYTVTASAPGYVTQTRLVELAGNVDGVDFDLVRTTATITGVVASNVSGPLPGATITISRDSLSFSASSAAAPQPGAFTVDDLPPGTYVVSFSRFDHAAQSQLVTLSAGQVLDLGTITLTFTDVPILPSTGSINVDVVDSQNDPLNDATVRILDVSTRAVVAELDGTADQSSFIFQNVPVGTYIVQAERRLYRVSETRISVGLGPQSVTAQMFLLGQVSGRLVDSLNNQQLTDYEISISRINANGTLTLVERVTVGPNQAPDPLSGRIEWESSPNSLTTGTYRVEITDPPPGYRVLADQVIDPFRPAAPVMEFEISPTQEDPIQLLDVEADRFPRLTGRIYKPLLATPLTNTVDFATIDDNSLTVTLTCPGAAPIAATLTDTVQPQPGLDTFTITPIQLEAANASGNCTLATGATGFVTATSILDPPLLPSDGVADPDQVVNVALVAPTDAIAGVVEWEDATTGNRFPINGASIVTSPNVIVGFERAQGTDANAEPTPVLSPVPLQSSSLAGAWRLDGQVFGQSTYTFSHPNFVSGSMVLTIDETPPRTVTTGTGLVSAIDPGPVGGIEVTMDPRPGALRGRVIVTTVGTPRYGDFVITGDAPGAASNVTATFDAVGNYAISPAIAGTWTVSTVIDGDDDPTDPRDYTPTTAPSVTRTLQPVEDAQLGTISVTEHGRLEVRVLDVAGDPIPGATLTIQRSDLAAPPQTIPLSGGTAFARRLDLFPFLPSLIPVRYAWSISAPGFDTINVTPTLTLNGAQSLVETDPNGLAGTFEVVAGAKPTITVTMPKFGSISANAVGRVAPAPAATENLTLAGGLSVQATRIGVFRADGSGAIDPASGPTISAVVDPADADGFTLTGPPGAYRLAFTHPDFDPVDFSVAGSFPAPDPACTVELGCYLIENDVDRDYTTPFELPIKRIRLDVRAITDLTSQTAVDASVTLNGGTPLVTPGSFTSLVPGTYAVAAVRRDGISNEDTHFPVRATIEVVRYSSTGGDGIVSLTLLMPRLGNSLTGSVGAVNTEGDPVLLPASFRITRAYDAPDGSLDGAAVDNVATEGDVVGNAPDPFLDLSRTATPGEAVSYTFDNIATGAHTLSLSPEDGYDTPTISNPFIVTGTQLPVPPANYIARDVTVVVDVTSLGQPLGTATVRLTSPDAEVLVPTVSGGTYTFTGVEPELTTYQLQITDSLHQTINEAVNVEPDPDGTLTLTRAVTPTLARIEGTAQLDPIAGAPVALANQGTVTLRRGTTVVDTVTPGANGAFAFLVGTAATDYTVQVSFTGYASRTSGTITAVLGRTTAPPVVVTIPELVSATVTIAGPATNDTSRVLSVSPEPAPSTPPSTANPCSVCTIRGLDPGVQYTFTATAATFYTASQTLTPSASNPNAFTITMTERTVTVTVETENDDTAAEAAATVTLTIGANTYNPTAVANVYTFRGIPTGAGTVGISRTGYRSQTIAVDASTTPAAPAPVTLRTLVTISGTVTSGGTAVSGASVTLSTGASTTTDTNGAYSFTGLDVGSYTVTASRLGYGTATTAAAIVVTATTPAAASIPGTTVVDTDLALQPRDVTVTFAVDSPAGTDFAGASVSVDGGTAATTNAQGTATVTVSEKATAYNWTVSATGKLTRTGSFTLANLTPTVSTVLFDRPTVNGTVTDGGDPQNNADVFLCVGTVTTCTSSNDIATGQVATTNASGQYSFVIDAGSWKIGAAQGGESATSAEFTVNPDGTTTSPIVIPNLALA